MAKQRATFGKLQRERDKQAKAAAKRERRATRGDEEPDDGQEAPVFEDQAVILDALAALQEAYDSGSLGMVEFEARRDELRERLQID